MVALPVAMSVVTVNLGVHRFGRLAKPATVVAKAGPQDVGFPPPGEICCGPDSFDIGGDRSVWLLDGVNQRLLAWSPGKANAISRTIQLPQDCCEDFALASNGAIYATSSGTSSHHLNFLYRLDHNGSVVWKGDLAAQGFPVPLRMGPGGILYSLTGKEGSLGKGILTWQPATTAAGRALPAAQQRLRAQMSQPLAGGKRLTTFFRSAHEARFTVGRRTWRVLSRTPLEPVLEATHALVGNDLAVVLTVWTQKPFRSEYLVLRLTTTGARTRLSLGHHAPLAGWGDMVTDVRIRPDGNVYQLGTSPTTGAVIRRYSLR